MTKSLGTRLKLICDGIRPYVIITFISMWSYNKNNALDDMIVNDAQLYATL